MTFGRMMPVGPPTADHALLDRFVAERDEVAFGELVRRHGPTVFGVCRRMLGHHQDAEDATQAVFVVLARHATGIRSRESVAAWLHGVAVRVCRKARSRRKPTAPIAAEPGAEPSWHDGMRAIDDALATLPEPLRQPVVLCYLHGMTRDEAAAELGLNDTTFRGRLDRGKERLRKELARRGFPLAAGLIAAGITTPRLAAAAIETIVGTAVGSVPLPASIRSLVTGVLPMSQMKFWLAGLLAVGLLAAGVVGWVCMMPAPTVQADTFTNLAKPDPKAGKTDTKLEGVWTANSSADEGKITRDTRIQFVDGQHLVWGLTHTSNNLPGPTVITMRMKYEVTKEGELKVEVLERWDGVDKRLNLPENERKPRAYSMTWDKEGKSFTLKSVPASESPWATMVFARADEKASPPADPLVPESLTKIDRKIAKLPKLSIESPGVTTAQVQPQSSAPDQPGYCLLAFGPKADFRVWLILDGEKLYVDRNGNGDLTDEKPVAATKVIGGRNERFFTVDSIGAEKEEKKWTLAVSIVPVGASQPGAVFMATRDGRAQKVGPMDFRFADSPDTARVVHFGSEVLAVRPSLTMPSVLEEGEKVAFRVQVGTPGVGAGSFASVSNDGLNKKANPVAEFTFPPAKPGDKPVSVKAELKERCCGDQFFAAVEVPKGTTGKASVTIRFPDYPHGSVTPFTGEVPVLQKK